MTNWATPATAVASTGATAADFNTHRDGLLHLRERTTQKPKGRVYRSGTTQNIATATPTAVAFDAERDDPNAMHNTVTNNSRITCVTGYAGWYRFWGCVEFAANATGVRELYWRKNGTTIVARVRAVPASGNNWPIECNAYVLLAVGDYMELIANQTSGGNLDLNKTGDYSTEAAWAYIGED